MTLKDRVLNYLENRRNNILTGNINSIPSPFKRFSNDYIGVEQGRYTVLTAGTKIGKTQIASFLYLYNPLLYSYYHPEEAQIKIFYYPLEETPEAVMTRFMSYLLYTLSNGKIRIAPSDLRSSKNDNPLSQEILDLLKSEEYNKILNYFQENIIFSTSTNATGVWMECVKYAEENGTVYKKKQTIKDEFGISREIDIFDYYESNNPKEYRLIFYDHISLTSTEKGLSTKQSIDKLSEYMVLLRNRYNYSPVVIQQQAFSNEGLGAFKEGKIRPSVQGAADSKYTMRDCDLCLGLFSPFRFELPDYLGYNVKLFKDNLRFMEVLINRHGASGGIIGLFFDGTVNSFSELPLPNDELGLSKVYNYINSLRNKNKPIFFINKIKKANVKFSNYFRKKWYREIH